MRAEVIEKAILRAFKTTFESDQKLMKFIDKMEKINLSKMDVFKENVLVSQRELTSLRDQEAALLEGITSAAKDGNTPKALQWLEGQLGKVGNRISELETHIQDLQGEMEEIQRMKDSDPKKVRSKLEAVFQKLSKAEPIRQRNLFRQVFKKIEVSEHGKVRIVWVDSSDPVITGGEENFPPFLSGGPSRT